MQHSASLSPKPHPVEPSLLTSALLLSIQWRLLLGAAVSSALAFMLVSVFSWFSGWQGLVFAVLGTIASAAASGPEGSPEGHDDPETSAAAAWAAAAFAGAVWGAASASSMQSLAAGGVVLVLGVWLALQVATLDTTPASRDRVVVGALIATVTFLAGAGITGVVRQ